MVCCGMVALWLLRQVPMITSIEINSSRCLRLVSLRLSPLTIIVGPNASGKSAILKAIGGDLGNHWRNQNSQAAQHRIIIRSSAYGSQLKGIDSTRYSILALDPNQLRTNNVLQKVIRLHANGHNLTNFFGSLTRKQQVQLGQELCQLVPLFSDVDTQPTTNGQHQLIFQDRWDASVWYTPREVSDGTMLMLFFLALSYQQTPPELIAIEEPERGLHPYLLAQLVSLLRDITNGKRGLSNKPIQFILATHSPQLLESALPEEVRFLDRDPNTGETLIKEAPTQSPEWEEAFKIYQRSLSGAWLSGNLGGIPLGPVRPTQSAAE
jgi:predicted ATPase